jgi:hypothetical protein
MSLPARNALLALFITAAIIGTVVYAINYLNRQREAQLSQVANQLTTDTLSVDTQFALLENAPCEDLTDGDELSQELGTLGDNLASAESRLGSTDPQVLQLKEQYTLLEIRDYLLTKQIANTCHVNPTTVLYFYSNAGDCTSQCDRAGAALSYLHQTYPALRVYSFDYNLNLGALKTLIAVEKVKPSFPAFIIEGNRSYGFTDLQSFETLFPKTLFATTTATSTASSTSRK